VSLDFLSPDATGGDDRFIPVARSPMERKARAAGARFAVRDGWNVAVAYTDPERELALCRTTAGWADVSRLGKLELQAGEDELASILAAAGCEGDILFSTATRSRDAWWCRLTPVRALVICETAALPALRDRLLEAAAGATQPASVLDVTTLFAALTLVGPQSREVFARFCALDLRPQVTPLAALRPGSIARQPGILVRESEDRFLFLFGWAVADYMWTVVADAAAHLGGGPVGADALAQLPQPQQEVGASA
jgi:heterotetrameric sarcosine oxidase gamma subunit